MININADLGSLERVFRENFSEDGFWLETWMMTKEQAIWWSEGKEFWHRVKIWLVQILSNWNKWYNSTLSIFTLWLVIALLLHYYLASLKSFQWFVLVLFLVLSPQLKMTYSSISTSGNIIPCYLRLVAISFLEYSLVASVSYDIFFLLNSCSTLFLCVYPVFKTLQ